MTGTPLCWVLYLVGQTGKVVHSGSENTVIINKPSCFSNRRIMYTPMVMHSTGNTVGAARIFFHG